MCGEQSRWPAKRGENGEAHGQRVAISFRSKRGIGKSGRRACVRSCRFVGTRDGKPGDAATSRHAHGHLLMTIDIDGPNVQGAAGSEAELQLGSFCHSQHAFDAVWLLWTDLQSARAASSVSAGASFTLHVSCTSRRVVQTFLACFSTYCLLLLFNTRRIVY